MPDLGLELALKWGGAPGQGYFYNVLHANINGGGTLDQAYADAIADKFHDVFVASDFINHVSTDVFMDKIRVSVTGQPSLGAFESPITVGGADSDTVLPAQDSLVTTLRSADGSRRGRGRIYNAGYTIAAVAVGGGVASGVSEDTNQFWVDLNSGLSDLIPEISLAVYSRADDEHRNVIGMNTDRQWDTQRRRRQ